MAFSIQQAAMEALAAYLRTELCACSGLQIFSRWPEANVKLPPRAISLISAADRRDELMDVDLLDTVDNGDGTVTCTWRTKSSQQDVQLDIWANSDVARDDLVARLEAPLTRGSHIIDPTADPFGGYLTLPLGNGWTGAVDFIFDRAGHNDTPDAVQRSEYRETYSGVMYLSITQTAKSAKLSRILVKAKFHGVDSDGSELPYTTIAVIPPT